MIEAMEAIGDAFPHADGSRLEWGAVPPALLRAVQARLPVRIVEAHSQAGGFSPGVAVRLRLADGSRVFAKAAGPLPNPEAADVHRREGCVAAMLPDTVSAPRLLFSVEVDGWVALCFEDIDGHHPVLPWVAEELQQVLITLTDLARVLTPSPIALPLLADDEFTGFRELLTTRKSGDSLSDMDPWVQRNLPGLAERESRWMDAATGTTLLHTDIRADNLLLVGTRVYVIDWPHAAIGPPWVDLLFMLPSVAMQHGPEPWHVFDSHPLTQGADPDAVTTVLCGLTGFFLCEARKPAPPGLPTLRRFQDAQGVTALAWLRRRAARSLRA
jgi:hypothetical protein